ncbi:MAG: TonB-dependent receptor [candidate division KSB1 bacterium]|nr:TonB-dependent receptor [candidate division KSB1 bacterium]
MSLENQTPQSVVRRLGLFFIAPVAAFVRSTLLPLSAVFLLVVSLLPAAGSAQSIVKIEGIVVDAETGEPLSGANVQIVGTALGSAADGYGRFFFENLFSGSYRMRVTFMGYAPAEAEATVSKDMPALLVIKLKRQVLELPELRVEGERDSTSISGTVVLTRADISRSQAATLGELLSRAAGLEVRRSGGTGARETVSIRGSNANQVLVLLDGLKLNDELTGEADLSQVPLNLIERVEVIRSGAGYGAGAVGGVIRLTTLQRPEARLQFDLQTGSFGFRRAEPLMSGSWKGIELTAAGQMMDSRGNFDYRYRLDDRQLVEAERINADFSSANLFGQITGRRNDGSLSLKGHRFVSERGQPGSVFSPTPYARSQSERSAAVLHGSGKVMAATVSVQISAMQNRTISRNEMPNNAALPFGPVPQFAFENKLQTLQAQLEAEWRGKERQRLGAQMSHTAFTDRNLRKLSAPIGRTTAQSLCIYAAPRWSRNLEAVTLQLDPSLRYEAAHMQHRNGERIERRWIPQISGSLIWGTSQRLRLHGAVGRDFRMPTFADLFYQDFRVQGQADLLPEKSRFAELAAGIDFRFAGNLSLELRRYRNRIDDMIVWRLGSFEFFRPFNTDAELSGWESRLSFSAAVLQVNLFYTLQQPLNKNRNITLYNRLLPYRAKEMLRADFAFNFGLWQFGLQVRGAGKRYINEANTKSLPPYCTADLTLRFKPNVKWLKTEVSLGAFNVLNARYELVRDMPLPGREIRAGLVLNR